MGFLTIFISVLLALTAGLFFIGVSLDLIVLNTLVSSLENEIAADFTLRLAIFLGALVVVLLCLRYVQRSLLRHRKDKAITFESARGDVSITLFAIEDMLKKLLEERKEISHIRAKVSLKKKTINVLARAVLIAEVNLVAFTKSLQDSVTDKVHSLLGEDKKVKVNLEIKKVALGGKRILLDEKEPEVPFRNYE